MAFSDIPQFDKHGLPIPIKLDRNPYEAGDSLAPPRSPAKILKYKRPLLALVILGIIAAIILPNLKKDVGRLLAIRHLRRSEEFIHRRQPLLAQRQVDQAVFWGGDHPPIRWKCAQMRLETGDAKGCVRDCKKLLELQKADREIEFETHLLLANANQRLRNWPAAIESATRLIELRPEESEPWNVRAYMRALSNVDLEAGLTDIESALRVHRDQRGMANDRTEAFYLDTRGYLFFRLGRIDEALQDLETALQIVETARDQFRFAGDQFGWGSRNRWEIAHLEESLAVMYHHRGEIFAAMAKADLAAEDFERAVALGYSPENGVE